MTRTNAIILIILLFSLEPQQSYAADSGSNETVYYSCKGTSDYGTWQQTHYFDFSLQLDMNKIIDWKVIGEAPTSWTIVYDSAHSSPKLSCGISPKSNFNDKQCDLSTSSGLITLYHDNKYTGMITKLDDSSYKSGFGYFSTMPDISKNSEIINRGKCFRRN